MENLSRVNRHTAYDALRGPSCLPLPSHQSTFTRHLLHAHTAPLGWAGPRSQLLAGAGQKPADADQALGPRLKAVGWQCSWKAKGPGSKHME